MKTESYNSFPLALDALAARLRNREFSLDEYYVVLTPDRYTLYAETALFSGSGAIDCEVLTLSRLAGRIGSGCEPLSREGGVMLTARALSAVTDKLNYYRHAAGFYEFAREIYETFQQISASDIELFSLSAKGSLAEKLHDLKLIRAEYDALKGGLADASDRLNALISDITKSEFVRKTRFYAIGYGIGGATTRLNLRVFAALDKYARAFEFIDALPPLGKIAAEIFRASDRIDQYKRAACIVRDHVYRGGSYGDVSLVCPHPRTAGRILAEYDIPFYTDETVALSDTPPLRFIEGIYKLCGADDADALVTVCKNPFSGCDEDDADELGYYVRTRGISYGALSCEYEGGAKRCVERVKRFIEMMKGDFCKAAENIVEFGNFEDIHKELYPDGTDMIAPIFTLTELLSRYGSGDLDADAAAFFSAARATDVNSLPRLRDRVTVTSAATLRMKSCPLLIVTDFNEGELPAAIGDNGLLSDAELSALSSPNGKIEPTVREQNKRARTELKAVIRNASRAVCMYETSGGARPSSFLKEICEPSSSTDSEGLRATLKRTDDAELIACSACTYSAAREMAARRMTAHSASLRAAAGEGVKLSPPFKPYESFERKPTLSVSELSHWFKCPYKRFLLDEVGIKERRDGKFTAPDFGIVVHEFMRRFIAVTPYDTSREAVEKLIDSVLDDMRLQPEPSDRRRLVDDAVDYARANVKIIEAGDYRPVAAELSFAGDLTFGKAGVQFVGTIDRVDRAGDSVRIIDYKTGQKKFSLQDCLNGCDMQLPLYAATRKENVSGMFYVPLSARYNAEKPKLTVGKMVKDVGEALRYDRDLRDLEPSKIFSVWFKYDEKKGEYSFNDICKGTMTREDFDRLIERCKQNADMAADEIADGYIDRAPLGDACKACPFSGICGDRVNVRSTGEEDEE